MKAIKKLFVFANEKILMIPVVLAAVEEQQIQLEPGEEPWRGLAAIRAEGFVSASIKLLLVIAALVSFFFLLIGGVKWILSGGDKEQTAKAQGTITAALIGLVIVFAAWAILKLIETFFGIPITTLKIPQIGK